MVSNRIIAALRLAAKEKESRNIHFNSIDDVYQSHQEKSHEEIEQARLDLYAKTGRIPIYSECVAHKIKMHS